MKVVCVNVCELYLFSKHQFESGYDTGFSNKQPEGTFSVRLRESAKQTQQDNSLDDYLNHQTPSFLALSEEMRHLIKTGDT